MTLYYKTYNSRKDLQMKYFNQFYKELENLSYCIYSKYKYNKPKNWKRIKKYEQKKNGFYAEAFQNENGRVVLVYRGTDTGHGINELRKDLGADIKLSVKKIPQQAYDAYLAYEDINNRYDNVLVTGYSLGGSLAQIVCNETGAEGITFAAYGVGDIVASKHTSQITNFGNENDPIFKWNMHNQLGTNYIIPDSDTSLESGKSLSKHMPNQIGDVSKAIEQKDLYVKAQQNRYVLDRYLKKYYDENLLVPSNRIFHTQEMNVRDMDEETLKQYVNQYYDNDYKFPQKEELDRRVRFGELIHVESYVRSGGTTVNGYYRRYPKN